MSDYDEVRDVDLGDLSLGQSLNSKEFMKGLDGKKVLMLIHGYNNKADSICSSYWIIANAVNSLLKNSNGTPLYDMIIGYVWPGENSQLEYFEAKANAGAAAYHLRWWLNEINSLSPNVELDLMTHSMGARVLLSSLKISNTDVKIRNAYMLASAVDNESIEPNEEFYNAVIKCEKFYVFHSVNDNAMLIYQIPEFDKPLGFAGPEDISLILTKMKNVKVINCKNYVKSHSAYKECDLIYKYILTELTENYSKEQFTTL
jgi:esterase/lipase superfamily enzyme